MSKGKYRSLRWGLLVLMLFSPLQAQEFSLSWLRSGECTLRLQADFRWHVLTVRISPENCSIPQDQLFQLMQQAVADNDSVFRNHRFSSVFIGRAVEYPWLSNYINHQALMDSAWSKKQGRPRRQNINTYVARLAGKHPFIEKLNSVLANIHYKITGVSVEKVLVGRYRQLHDYTGPEFKGGAPFDAQIYLLLQPLK